MKTKCSINGCIVIIVIWMLAVILYLNSGITIKNFDIIDKIPSINLQRKIYNNEEQNQQAINNEINIKQDIGRTNPKHITSIRSNISFWNLIKNVETRWKQLNMIQNDKCRAEYGLSLLKSWKNQKYILCSNNNNNNNSSFVECYIDSHSDVQRSVQQKIWWVICKINNAQIKWKLLNKKGSFQLNCKLNKSLINSLRFNKQNFYVTPDDKHLENWFVKSLNTTNNNIKTCDFNSNYNSDITYMVHRLDEQCYYHAMEDFITRFMELAVLDIHPLRDKLRVLFIDEFNNKDGMFNKIYLNLFSSLYYKNNEYIYHKIPYNDKYDIIEDRGCYPNLIHHGGSGRSLLVFKGIGSVSKHDLNCRSSIITAFSDYFLTSFNLPNALQNVLNKLSKNTKQKHKILLISRQDVSQWAVINSKPRTIINKRKMDRVINNEDSMIKFIENDILLNRQKEFKYEWIFEKIVLEKVKLENQLLITTNADILIGVHGAGLTHIITMTSKEDGWSYLIEIFCGNRSPVNAHYRYLTYLKGIGYIPLPQEFPGCSFNKDKAGQNLQTSIVKAIKNIEQHRQSDIFLRNAQIVR